MINFASLDPEITSALIAAVVSLLIAAVSGLYTLRVARRRISHLREEIMAQEFTTNAAKRFLHEHGRYVENYKNYESVLRDLTKLDDGTKSVQHVVDFIANNTKPLILQFPDILGADILELDRKFDKAVEECKIKFDPSNPDTHSYATELGYIGIGLAARVYEVRPR